MRDTQRKRFYEFENDLFEGMFTPEHPFDESHLTVAAQYIFAKAGLDPVLIADERTHALDPRITVRINRRRRNMNVCLHSSTATGLLISTVELVAECAGFNMLVHELAHAISGYGEGHGPGYVGVYSLLQEGIPGGLPQREFTKKAQEAGLRVNMSVARRMMRDYRQRIRSARRYAELDEENAHEYEAV